MGSTGASIFAATLSGWRTISPQRPAADHTTSAGGARRLPTVSDEVIEQALLPSRFVSACERVKPGPLSVQYAASCGGLQRGRRTSSGTANNLTSAPLGL